MPLTNKKDIRIFYGGSQDYFIDLAVLLNEKYGWVPVYWLTDEKQSKKIMSLFDGVKTHDYIDSIKGIGFDGFDPSTMTTVCPDILVSLYAVEANALLMMERNDSNSNSFFYRERIELYHYLVSFWCSVLCSYKIDYVIFEEEPHQASDYVLYKICQVLNIKTILFVRTISSLGILPAWDFETRSNFLSTFYLRNVEKVLCGKNVKISTEVLEYFSKLNGQYEKVLADHLWDQVDGLTAKGWVASLVNLLSKINEEFSSKQLKTRIQLLSGDYSSDQKETNKKFHESKQSYAKSILYKIKAIYIKSILREYYENIAYKGVFHSEKFIFCALQYQPEKSTCPLGGLFAHQHLVVDVLATNLPDGWKLYVKEHPSQFVKSYTRYGEQSRSKYFYQRLLRNRNVKLLPLNTDVFNLIDNAEAVASVGGTVCWEAVARGTPALNFGKSWFSGCEGIYDVGSKESVQRAIKQIISGKKVNRDMVMVFAQTIHDLGLGNGVIGGVKQLKHKGITSGVNAETHLKAIETLFSASGRTL